jgi:hypothetical protein
MTARADDAEDEMELRVCVHVAITNEEGQDNDLTHHNFTLETNLDGRSMDELLEIALEVAKVTFWGETTISIGITVTFVRQVHAQRM